MTLELFITNIIQAPFGASHMPQKILIFWSKSKFSPTNNYFPFVKLLGVCYWTPEQPNNTWAQQPGDWVWPQLLFMSCYDMVNQILKVDVCSSIEILNGKGLYLVGLEEVQKTHITPELNQTWKYLHLFLCQQPLKPHLWPHGKLSVTISQGGKITNLLDRCWPQPAVNNCCPQPHLW